jgi:hypothetical protein
MKESNVLPLCNSALVVVHGKQSREIQCATFLVGIVLNDLLSVALKKVIQEPRPPTCKRAQRGLLQSLWGKK